MSDQRGDVIAFLIRRGVASREQLDEAWELCRQTGFTFGACLIRLGYATPGTILGALAEYYGLRFIDLSAVVVPPEVVELVPESVARENVVFPVEVDRGSLTVAMSDPTDLDTLQKLQFILNRDVRPVIAPREQIIEAINRHYGQSETESVDSMLAEFTDTAIDFTESEAPEDDEEDLDFEEEDDFEPDEEPRARRPSVGRQATIRYYHRMNPERLFPLLVVLSEKEIQSIVKAGVSQRTSGRFEVKLDSVVEVEPILPGCDCFPPKEQVTVRAGRVEVTFWVVPHVLGQLRGARVVVRQGGTVLAEVPLEGRIVKQGLTVALGALSLLLPFALTVLKHFRLDFESQLHDGFGVYNAVAGWVVQSLSPEVLTGVLLAATVAAYFWLRPRKRDLFWDVRPVDHDEPTQPPTPRTAAPVRPPEWLDRQRAYFLAADEHFAAEEYRPALRLYDLGLRLGPAPSRAYQRASLSAHYAGQTSRALEILRRGVASLPPGEAARVMHYNMGCFAGMLGQGDEAMTHLRRAVALGYDDARKYQSDDDLAALRRREDFRRMLAELRSAAKTKEPR